MRHRAQAGAWQDGEALNIGSGGAFVIGATWPVGTEVELAVAAAGRPDPLVLSGVVRWTAGDGSADAATIAGDDVGLGGVGVQFLDLDLDVVIELNAHLARLAADAAGAAPERETGDDDDADLPTTD